MKQLLGWPKLKPSCLRFEAKQVLYYVEANV